MLDMSSNLYLTENYPKVSTLLTSRNKLKKKSAKPDLILLRVVSDKLVSYYLKQSRIVGKNQLAKWNLASIKRFSWILAGLG